jgi:hypothetical protein
VSEQPGNCASCGAPLPADAKYCHSCGAAVAAETRAAPRWFGVAPATLLLAIAVVALGAATALLVAGSLVPGLLLLGVALLLLAAFLEVARRKPDAPVAQKAAGAADSFKARAGFTAQALRTRSSARRAIKSRRAQALQLQGERDRLMRSLGEAAYRGEDESAVREQIAGVEARQGALQTEAEEIARRADEEVERASRAVQPTEVRPPVRD